MSFFGFLLLIAVLAYLVDLAIRAYAPKHTISVWVDEEGNWRSKWEGKGDELED